MISFASLMSYSLVTILTYLIVHRTLVNSFLTKIITTYNKNRIDSSLKILHRYYLGLKELVKL